MSFWDVPSRSRLALILLGVGVLVLLIAYAARTARQGMVENVATLGRVVAINSATALALGRTGAADEVLAALRAEPHIAAAALYGRSGTLFVRYSRGAVPPPLPEMPPADGYHFEPDRLIDVLPVQHDGKPRLGTLYIASDLSVLNNRIALYGGITAAIIACSLILAALLSEPLQRHIALPILRFADAVRAAWEKGSYSLRMHSEGGNQINRLGDAFNRVLDEMQQHHALSANAECLRAVINSALSAAAVIDTRGHIIDWNARAETMFGWTLGEALGGDLAEMMLPAAMLDAHQRGLRAYFVENKLAMLDHPFEMTMLRRDGSEFPAELSVSSLNTGEGVKFCCFIIDITERKQAELRLQAQLKRSELLHRITRAIGRRQNLQSISQVLVHGLEESLSLDFSCICLYDSDAQLLTVTSIGPCSAPLAAQLQLGVGAQLPADGGGLSNCLRGELVYEPDITDLPFQVSQHLVGSGLRSLVLAPLALEGKVVGMLITAKRIARGFSDADCEFLRQFGEHAALAAHQAQLYTVLQQAYDNLRHTQQTMFQQERLRMLGQMASGIAHDINNALSPVALYTETLLEQEAGLSVRARRQLLTIQRAVDDVAQTLARMHEFYRQHDVELELAPVRLNSIVPQVIDLTRARWSDIAQRRGIVIEVRTELADGLPELMGVESELRDALTNLILNAVDAMPESGSLTICTGVLEDHRRRVYVEVTDTGVGMDEETRRRCLEPFFTTKGERGTGLGLAMVYGMVQRHGAEIELDSAQGRGTRVRLCFRASAQPVSAASSLGERASGPQCLRVLIVDDDPLVISSLRDTLQQDGHCVTTADGGRKGIDKFIAALQSGECYDAVITDLGMPYVDGRQVAAEIKRLTPAVPIIMLTGWGERLVAEDDVPTHVDKILNKPPHVHELREALSACCAVAHAA